LRELFATADVVYPPESVFLRAFKREREMELWAGKKGGALKLIATYGVAAASGGPGPKRREGDAQVPEGFYEVDRFNPESSFHLSLGLDYPNTADRALSDPSKPGYNIFIHGNAASIGCLAMGDDRIEEIYVAALDAKTKPVNVHIFPARMNSPDWPKWRDEQIASRAELSPLWEQLQRGFDAFEAGRRVPKIGVRENGEYFIHDSR
jgi:murein L,D-transpeptidase YafK